MAETLELLSIDFWQTLMAIGNLIILYFIVKKFLYKPVNEILESRAKEVDDIYSEAENMRKEARTYKETYEDKLNKVKNETDQMIKKATESAKLRSEEILNEAIAEADNERRKAENDIYLAKKKAMEDLSTKVSSMVVELSKQIVQKEIDLDAHQKLIDSAIDKLGESV
ncbi:MAG: F0F1 ATP synthase subunit B [Clostridiales bacterium]|nr:F0F1 ATP synthase subunit B [Clostridiales bacterium]